MQSSQSRGAPQPSHFGKVFVLDELDELLGYQVGFYLTVMLVLTSTVSRRVHLRLLPKRKYVGSKLARPVPQRHPLHREEACCWKCSSMVRYSRGSCDVDPCHTCSGMSVSMVRDRYQDPGMWPAEGLVKRLMRQRVLLALCSGSGSSNSAIFCCGKCEEQRARDASSGGSLRHRLSLKPLEASIRSLVGGAWGGGGKSTLWPLLPTWTG